MMGCMIPLPRAHTTEYYNHDDNNKRRQREWGAETAEA